MWTTVLAFLFAVTGTAQMRGGAEDSPSEMRNMVYIEGGTFEMGDVLEDGIRLASPVHDVTVSSFYLNKYEVTVEAFSAFVEGASYVTSAETAVNAPEKMAPGASTQEGVEYSARLASRGAWALETPTDGPWVEEANWRNPQYEHGPKDPVTCVSWQDAIRFCNWLSQKEGLPIAYDAATGDLLDHRGRPTTDVTRVGGYRLPTEAEWEFAARERGKRLRFGNGRNIARASEINFNAASS